MEENPEMATVVALLREGEVDLSATQDHKYTMVADICWPLPFRKKRKQTKTEVKSFPMLGGG